MRQAGLTAESHRACDNTECPHLKTTAQPALNEPRPSRSPLLRAPPSHNPAANARAARASARPRTPRTAVRRPACRWPAARGRGPPGATSVSAPTLPFRPSPCRPLDRPMAARMARAARIAWTCYSCVCKNRLPRRVRTATPGGGCNPPPHGRRQRWTPRTRRLERLLMSPFRGSETTPANGPGGPVFAARWRGLASGKQHQPTRHSLSAAPTWGPSRLFFGRPIVEAS
jgi:hypothetical protein